MTATTTVSVAELQSRSAFLRAELARMDAEDMEAQQAASKLKEMNAAKRIELEAIVKAEDKAAREAEVAARKLALKEKRAAARADKAAAKVVAREAKAAEKAREKAHAAAVEQDRARVRAEARETILAILKEQGIKPRELARLLKAEAVA